MSSARNRLALLAAVATISLSGITLRADEAAAAPAADTLSLSPVYAAANPAPRQPLMSLLDAAGVGQALDSARINVYGHVEAGYTYNFDNPAKDLNLGRVADVAHAAFEKFFGVQLDVLGIGTVDDGHCRAGRESHRPRGAVPFDLKLIVLVGDLQRQRLRRGRLIAPRSAAA